MTVSSTARRAGPFAGNDATTSFPFTFRVFEAADIAVTHTSAAGVETVLTLNSHYSVALNADQGVSPGGSVTYPLSGVALPTGETLAVVGGTAYEQDTDVSNAGRFLPGVLENALDKQTILSQQLDERMGRALVFSVNDTAIGTTMPAAADRAGLYLAFDAEGDPTASSGTGADAGLRADLAAPGGSTLAGFLQSGVGGVARTAQAKMREIVSLRDFGGVCDGVADDADAFDAALAAHDRVWVDGTPMVSRVIRAAKVIHIESDRDTTVTAGAGFTGIAVTQAGAPFTLKAVFAVFHGSTIGTQTGTRLGETGESVSIGPLQIDCAGNADYGVYLERAPGATVEANVKSAAHTGIYLAPGCWGSTLDHNRVTDCVTFGIYLGEASNGVHILTPEIWGNSITTSAGIYSDGAAAGSIGASGGVLISGGYIEKCTYGVYLKDTQGTHVISGVDIEIIAQNAIYLDCAVASRSYGPVIVDGCNLSADQNTIYNKGCHVIVRGCTIADGYTLEPFYSENRYSTFDVSGGNSYYSGLTQSAVPALTATNWIVHTEQTGYLHKTINKRGCLPTGNYEVTWGLYNLSSESQPDVISSSLVFENSKQGGATDMYASRSVWRVNITETDPTPTATSSTAVVLGWSGGAKGLSPETDNDVTLGAAATRYSTVYAGTGTIDTSDAREKQQVRDLDATEKAVALELKGLIKAFKFNDAVQRKGDDARIHVGVVAQDVEQAFKNHGLDPAKYALFCWDEWYTVDGEVRQPDADGNYPPGAVRHDRYGLRYDQLLAFIISAL